MICQICGESAKRVTYYTGSNYSPYTHEKRGANHYVVLSSVGKIRCGGCGMLASELPQTLIHDCVRPPDYAVANDV